MFLSDENLLRKQSVAGNVFAVGWLKWSFILWYAQDLGFHMEVNSISFQTFLNTCLQNRIRTVADSYETVMALFCLDRW